MVKIAEKQRVMLLGDSLSVGYPLPLKQTWAYALDGYIASQFLPIELINQSINGEMSGQALTKLPRLLLKWQPA